MKAAFDTGKAPENAIVPLPIDKKKVFTLDIDSDVWNDAGLLGDDAADIPQWMSNHQVRQGIQALLEFHRCCEELQRLKVEFSNLRRWFISEIEAVQSALSSMPSVTS